MRGRCEGDGRGGAQTGTAHASQTGCSSRRLRLSPLSARTLQPSGAARHLVSTPTACVTAWLSPWSRTKNMLPNLGGQGGGGEGWGLGSMGREAARRACQGTSPGASGGRGAADGWRPRAHAAQPRPVARLL
jgi:hypothetical protein